MLETAIEVLEKCAQLVTASEEWGYESVTMEKEEIEIGTLPKDVHLPRLVMTHLYIYCAPEDGKDYVVYFITDITSQREFVRGLLVEGRLVWSQIEGTIDEINPKLIYNLKNNFQSLGIDEKTELVANERDQLLIEEFLDANWENHEFFQQFVAHFLGRGIGLTPSGDDMLMGMIMMSNSFSMPMEWSSFILTQLERTQTTKVSDAYYKALLSGYISTQFVSLLQIIKDKKMTDWNEAISRIADYGHTSGWDTLFGIFLFLQKLEKSLS